MKSVAIIFLAALLLPGRASTELEQASKLVWKSFISQTWVRTSENRVDGPSNQTWGSFNRHEVGVPSSYNLNEHIDFRGMIFHDGSSGGYQMRSPYSMITTSVSYAF